MNTLDDGQPEEFVLILKNFKIATDGTYTTTPLVRINYLCTMLRVQELSEFNELYIQYGGLTNNHLRIIQEGLIYDLFPINSLSKHKRAMRRAMRKPRSMTFKRFAARLTEINNFLLLFPG